MALVMDAYYIPFATAVAAVHHPPPLASPFPPLAYICVHTFVRVEDAVEGVSSETEAARPPLTQRSHDRASSASRAVPSAA